MTRFGVDEAGRFSLFGDYCADQDCTIREDHGPHVREPRSRRDLSRHDSVADELVARFTGIMQTAREPEDQARQLVTLLVLDYDVARRVIR